LGGGTVHNVQREAAPDFHKSIWTPHSARCQFLLSDKMVQSTTRATALHGGEHHLYPQVLGEKFEGLENTRCNSNPKNTTSALNQRDLIPSRMKTYFGNKK